MPLHYFSTNSISCIYVSLISINIIWMCTLNQGQVVIALFWFWGVQIFPINLNKTVFFNTQNDLMYTLFSPFTVLHGTGLKRAN